MSSDLVKKGNEKADDNYAPNRDQFKSIKYLEKFIKLVEKRRTVLDIGCGTGKPVDAFLVKNGYAVNGIDISEQMIELAKKNVPQAFYEVQGISDLKEGEYCVDGIVSFYAILHTPREQYQELFEKFVSFMPNGGALLVTLSAGEREGPEDDFHGVKIFWSHYAAEKNKEMVENAGFKIVLNGADTSNRERHQVIIAKLSS